MPNFNISKQNRTYIAIDLKSFSVECVERGLNPLTTNLVLVQPQTVRKKLWPVFWIFMTGLYPKALRSEE